MDDMRGLSLILGRKTSRDLMKSGLWPDHGGEAQDGFQNGEVRDRIQMPRRNRRHGAGHVKILDINSMVL
jgi:hypothetical protein